MTTYSLHNAPTLAAVEYPGPVKAGSVHRALKTLGGADHVSESLVESKSDKQIELNLNPKNPFHHPVPAAVVQTGNVVLRVTKRRRKQPTRDEQGNIVEEGVYKMQVVGVASQTVRFRAIADFQYAVNQSDPIVAISEAVRRMNTDAIKDFRWPEPTEDITEDSFLPPPSFSRLHAPQIYDYRSAHSTVPVEVVRGGKIITRLANSTRHKSKPTTTITFDYHPARGTEPEQGVLPLPLTPKQLKQFTGRGDPDDKDEPFEYSELELKIIGLLEERPIWTRAALFNQLTADERRVATNQKQVVPATAWTFADGPWRDSIIRFGYDPREEPEARFYQNVAFRNAENKYEKVSTIRKSASKGKGKQREEPEFEDPLRSHIFDGVTVNSKVGNFQLCDISDGMIVDLIMAPEAVSSTCTKDDGWWKPEYFAQIRDVLRVRFFAVLSGHTDVDYEELLVDPVKKAAEKEEARKKSGAKKGRKSQGGRHASQSDTASDTPSASSGGGYGSEQGEGAGSDRSATGEGETSVAKGRRQSKRNAARLPWQAKTRHRGAKRATETEEARAAALAQAAARHNARRHSGQLSGSDGGASGAQSGGEDIGPDEVASNEED